MRYDQLMAQEEANQSSSIVSFQIPVKLVVVQEPFGANETVFFAVQPKLKIVDASGSIVPVLGHGALNEWTLTASIKNGTGDPEARLEGNSTVPFVNGWANFTELSISHNATDYELVYTISKPSSAKFNATSHVFEVKERILEFRLTAQPGDANETLAFGQQPTIEVRDTANGEIVNNTGWKGRKWWFTAQIANPDDNSGRLNGTTEVEFVAGLAQFTNLSIDHSGAGYVLTLEAKTEPASRYEFNSNSEAFNVSERQFFLSLTQQPGDCNDTVVCGHQPVLEIRDGGGALVDNIGWRGREWFINATMENGQDSLINGTSLVPVAEVARIEFTDLSFYDVAAGHQMRFSVITEPVSSYSGLSVTSDTFNVSARIFYLAVVNQPGRANQSEAFGDQPLVEVRDLGTGLRASHLKGDWTVSVSLKSSGLNGTLNGTTNITVQEGMAQFSDLSISFYGVGYELTFTSNQGHQVRVSFLVLFLLICLPSSPIQLRFLVQLRLHPSRPPYVFSSNLFLLVFFSFFFIFSIIIFHSFFVFFFFFWGGRGGGAGKEKESPYFS